VSRGAAGGGSPLPLPGLAGLTPRRFALTVLGDVRLELRTHLPDRRFTELTRDHFTCAPMQPVLSGTAINLARPASHWFQRVEVVAKIGDDAFTDGIRRQVHDLGLGGTLLVAPGMPNGFTLMLRDRPVAPAGGAPDGVRLLVASCPAPSLALTPEDVQLAAAALAQADVVFLDGYSLLAPGSREALAVAAQLAHDAGAKVAVDLVPHDLDTRIALPQALPVLAAADAIVAEAGTAARLFGLPVPSGFAEAMALPQALDQRLPGQPLWLLRWGAGGADNSLIWQRDRVVLDYETGYAARREKAGFGDAMTAGELYWWLSTEASRRSSVSK
jgi:sugar/nucleoside kinase (ribokinase family)